VKPKYVIEGGMPNGMSGLVLKPGETGSAQAARLAQRKLPDGHSVRGIRTAGVGSIRGAYPNAGGEIQMQ